MAAHSCRNSGSLNVVLGKNACDDVGDVIKLHDLPVNDRVGLKILESEIHQLKVAAFPLQLNRFDGTRADIETNEIFLSHTFFEHDLFIPCDKESAVSVLLAK